MSYVRAKQALLAMRELIDSGEDDDLQIAADWAVIYMAEDRASAHGNDFRREYEARQNTMTLDNHEEPAYEPVD
jgi:hypothetical protein